MKISRQRLKQIIKEELSIIDEQEPQEPDMPMPDETPDEKTNEKDDLVDSIKDALKKLYLSATDLEDTKRSPEELSSYLKHLNDMVTMEKELSAQSALKETIKEKGQK